MRKINLLLMALVSLMLVIVISGCNSINGDIRSRLEQHYVNKDFNEITHIGNKLVIEKIINEKSSQFIIVQGYCDATIERENVEQGKFKSPVIMYFRVKYLKIHPKGFIENKYSQIFLPTDEKTKCADVVTVFWNNEEEIFLSYAYGVGNVGQ